MWDSPVLCGDSRPRLSAERSSALAFGDSEGYFNFRTHPSIVSNDEKPALPLLERQQG
jgi:hypothetical protein